MSNPLFGAVFINRHCGSDRSTVAIIWPDGHTTREQRKAYAQRLATAVAQACNGGVQFYVSQRPCGVYPSASESAHFITYAESQA